MGQKRLYLDSAPVIYLVEQVAPFASIVGARLIPGAPDENGADEAEELILVTSDLTRLECRVKPLRESDTELLRDFDEFFASVEQIVPLSRAVVDEATKIRATYGFKTPDALHLAAAVRAHCDVFYTNDHRLSRFSDLSLEVL
jgi:predicted nucleic acid-binding protein